MPMTLEGFSFMRRLIIRFVAFAAILGVLLVPAGASETGCSDVSSGKGEEVPSWVDTTALGAQPAGYELWAPARPVRGVIIGIHGGGWESVGPGALAALHYQAGQWVNRGFAFANFDYRICGDSLPDVEAMHDALRALVPGVPFCIMGESSGAHLALLLAADRPDSIACVIAKAPPANADLLATSNPALAGDWHDAFGDQWRTTYNPAWRVGDIKADVLLAVSTADTIVAPEQIKALAGENREALVLDGGDQWFPHAGITAAARDIYESRVTALLAPLMVTYTVPWAQLAPKRISQPGHATSLAA